MIQRLSGLNLQNKELELLAMLEKRTENYREWDFE